MKKLIFLTAFLFAFLTNGIAQKVFILKNHKIEFAVDQNGNMVTLKNLQTGCNYASGKPFWRLYFDRKNEKDIQVLAGDNQPVIRQTGNQILIGYDRLKTRNEDLKITLSLKIILEENMVRFCSEVTNNELHTIVRELQYPLVGNCQLPQDHQLLTTSEGGQLYPDPKKQILSGPYSFKSPDQYFRQMNVKYPVVSSNCFAFTGKTQGLYFGSHDSTFQDTWHGLRVYPDKNRNFNELEAGLYKYPNCLSGESWENDANVIAPYSGSWHETSKIYRAWANTWWDHKPEPDWIKNMNGFQRIIMRHQYGETLFTYDDFATKVREAGESVGINVVFPFGWWEKGMDNGYPVYSAESGQGGDEGWKKAVTEYKKNGGKVLLYYNGQLIDTESDYYKNGEGKKVSCKSNTGTEINNAYIFSGSGTFTGNYDVRTFVVADVKDRGWQKILISMADQAIKFGVNSVFYDQMGGAGAPNWDLSKEFPVPHLHMIADRARAMKMAHDYIDTKDKELAIGIEHVTDVTAQCVDYVHHTGSLNNRTLFLEWFRYTFPEVILSDRHLDGDESDIEWLVNQDLLLGLRNNLQIYRLRALITEVPHYQQHLAKINKMKQKYRQLLLLGDYKDTDGFSLDNNSLIKARSFVNGNRMAIVMTHRSGDRKMTRITVPGYRFIESDGVGDQTVAGGASEKKQVTIGKNSISVLIYEKKI